MFKKLMVIGLSALLLLAVVPGVAFAKAKLFTAAGQLEQGFGGVPEGAAVFGGVLFGGAGPVDVDPLAAGLFTFDSGTAGLLNSDQTFSGKLSESDWGGIKKAEVEVTHNSWITAGAGPAAITGVAWGEFTVTKGKGKKGSSLTGVYGATIEGVAAPVGFYSLLVLLEIVPPELAPPAELLECDVTLRNPGQLYIVVTDQGQWDVVDDSATGSFKNIESTGMPDDLTVTATGCLGEEKASFQIAGDQDGGKEKKEKKEKKDKD